MEDIYVLPREEIKKRKEEKVKLESELRTIEEKLSKIEEGSLSYKNGTYDKLLARTNYLKSQLEYYTWRALSEEEFREWYMKENEWLWNQLKSRGEEPVCDMCSKKIERPEEIRSLGGIDYHPEHFKIYALNQLKHKDVIDERAEFLLRSLKI